jgi:hypothetical protein
MRGKSVGERKKLLHNLTFQAGLTRKLTKSIVRVALPAISPVSMRSRLLWDSFRLESCAFFLLTSISYFVDCRY